MSSENYRILFHDIVLADHMTLSTALILLGALFRKLYNEPSAQYTIEKIPEEAQP